MTQIPVFSYSNSLARYWRRKGDWRRSQDPDETAYIPCRNVETARGDLAEFLLQIDPKTTVFFDGDYGELVDISEVKRAANTHGWRQRSAQFKQEIGLSSSPGSSAEPDLHSSDRPSTWSTSWQPTRDRPAPSSPSSPPSPSRESKLPPAFFDLINLLSPSPTSQPALPPTTEKLRRAYQQLALAPTTHWDTIQRAYRDRSRATHPDYGGQQSEFQAIQEAYKYLKQHYHPRRPLP